MFISNTDVIYLEIYAYCLRLNYQPTLRQSVPHFVDRLFQRMTIVPGWFNQT